MHTTSGFDGGMLRVVRLGRPPPVLLSGERPPGASQDLEKAGAKLGVISQAVNDVVQVRPPSLAFGRDARSQEAPTVESPRAQQAEGD